MITIRNVYTVGQLNSYIKNMFTQDYLLQRLFVKGEVSNCKYHSSGHIYFTLKDSRGTISCVMFAGSRSGLSFRMSEGQQVIVGGTVDVYERDGKYQLYARQIMLDGSGQLYEKFEQLKRELEESGMFAQEYKQSIPKFIKTLGVVTADTGAAVRDIIQIAGRRNPYVQIILYPAIVQGEAAVPSIVKGIRALEALGVDVMIVGRGGGSIEDLWAFNEEMVARAIFECGTPVISAVGHETDVTIADYVADMRAPTPSAAAELAVFDYSQFEAQTDLYRRTLNRGMERRLERVRYRLNQDVLRLKMHHPERQLNEKRQRLADLEDRMGRIMERRVTAGRHRLALLAGRLQSLSPLEQISRGYGFITDGGGKRLESVSQVKPGDRITVRVRDGRAVARVEETESLDDRKGGELT